MAKLHSRNAFSLDRCSVVRPEVRPGQWIAYYTEVGGPHWLRALVLRHFGLYVIAIDEDGELVSPHRWERVYQPPKLKPKILRQWLRHMAVLPEEPEPLA